jgi:hypothetical protein
MTARAQDWRQPLRTFVRVAAVLAGAFAAGAVPASATPIELTTVLTGDPRPGGPDDLTVLVSIVGDTDSNTTTWTVDLDMASSHPHARLDEFGFNLFGLSSQYSVSGLSLPYTPAEDTLNGSGGTQFLMTLNDPNGKMNDATNITSLTFSVIKTSNFTLADFLDAPLSCSNDSLFGCNQLGAHVQGLGAHGEDSGVAVGNFEPIAVPEPGTLLLVSLGAGAAVFRRRAQAPAR